VSKTYGFVAASLKKFKEIIAHISGKICAKNKNPKNQKSMSTSA
jgi:hypothetical protein